MDPENEIRLAEANKLNAERLKLELEAQEIERRLKSKWWQGSSLPQYVVAIVITTAVLFGWWITYLNPILNKKYEINKLVEELNNAEIRKLSQERETIRSERDKLKAEADQQSLLTQKLIEEQRTLTAGNRELKDENQKLSSQRSEIVRQRDVLIRERETLQGEREALKLIVGGLRIAVDRAAEGKGKFFSVLNKDDPITALERSYGWKLSSDNYFGKLHYYIVMTHKDVQGGKEIYVGREFEIEGLKKEDGTEWPKYIEEVNRRAPFLALDYSYDGLITEPDKPVGGTLYTRGGRVRDFHAPLRDWAKELAKLLQVN